MNRPSRETMLRAWRMLWDFYLASLERRRRNAPAAQEVPRKEMAA